MRNYNLRILKDRRTYTPSEISKLHKVGISTVYRWLKEGLSPIEPHKNPLLIYGREVKRFLLEKQKKHKTILKAGEFYCLRCRVARKGNGAKLIKTGRRTGKKNLEQFQHIAKCEVCSSIMRRFAKASPKRTN